MKKILPLSLTLCGAACLLAVAVHAADASAPAPASAASATATAARPGEKYAGMVADHLGLTAEQRTRLADLRQAQRTALDAVAGDKALSPEDRRAKVRGIMESNREQMKAVLTPDQQRQMARAHARMGAGRAGGHQKFGRGGPQHFGQHRPDPRQMAMRAHQKMKQQREKRAAALGLTDDQRAKMRLIAFQHREKAIGLQQELRTEMEAVLTPEQKAKAKELKAGHGQRGPGRHHGGGMKGPPPGH